MVQKKIAINDLCWCQLVHCLEVTMFAASLLTSVISGLIYITTVQVYIESYPNLSNSTVQSSYVIWVAVIITIVYPVMNGEVGYGLRWNWIAWISSWENRVCWSQALFEVCKVGWMLVMILQTLLPPFYFYLSIYYIIQ